MSKEEAGARLLERLKSWFELFAKREDIDVSRPLELAPPPESIAAFPREAANFARLTGGVSFRYTLRDCPPGQFDGGFLYLSLDGYEGDVYLSIPDFGTVEHACELDLDREGTGNMAWFILQADEPFIVWSVEDPVRFTSLSDYLTRGARNAFCYPTCWQRGGVSPLVARSLPKSTPLPEVRAALVQRGATPDVADDLIRWLESDVVLLLPRA
jgi:hypothetical protein